MRLRVLTITMLLFTVIVGFSAGVYYTTHRYVRSDINHDGKIDTNDLSILLADWPKKTAAK